MAGAVLPTVSPIAGGRTFDKAHRAHAADCLGAAPAGGAFDSQGLGWNNKCGAGNGASTVTSGFEDAWSANPIARPSASKEFHPHDSVGLNHKAATKLVPDVCDVTKRYLPMMFSTDISIKEGPEFCVLALRSKNNPQQFADAFARACFNLRDRDKRPRQPER